MNPLITLEQLRKLYPGATESVLRANFPYFDKLSPQPATATPKPPPSTGSFVVQHSPMGAVRMTRSDAWKKPRRPAVQKYLDYRDAIRAVLNPAPPVPDGITCVFHLPMPESWGKKKKAAMAGSPCKVKPDFDNLVKGVCDALWENDSAIWRATQSKYWAYPHDARTVITLFYD
jgi:Holliday junction resolvase RusA-like endonuclease